MNEYQHEVLEAVVDAAIAAYPTEEARIRRGAEIVRDGGVALATHRVTTRLNWQAHTYQVNGTCPCKDSQHQAPEGRCKHRWALAFAKRIAAMDPWQRTHSVADRDARAAAGELAALVCHPEWRGRHGEQHTK